MKADILFEALAALNAAADADCAECRLPTSVYMKVVQAGARLNAALKSMELEVEVTQ